MNKMLPKVLQIGYEPEKDRLHGTAGTFIADRAWMCYSRISSVVAHGGLFPLSATTVVGISLTIRIYLR